MRAVH